VSESYAGQQIVGMDLHRRRSVLVRMTKAGCWPPRAQRGSRECGVVLDRTRGPTAWPGPSEGLTV
jgi:hypothetical protein